MKYFAKASSFKSLLFLEMLQQKVSQNTWFGARPGPSECEQINSAQSCSSSFPANYSEKNDL
jgi:hypothetical protein